MSSAGAGFPRQRRIRRSREFQELSRRGERRGSSTFVLLAAKCDPPQGRLGVTVSRKVGNAVVRNRVKRRIREWFRREGAQQAPGLDLVVIARPPAARLASGATSIALNALIERQS